MTASITLTGWPAPTEVEASEQREELRLLWAFYNSQLDRCALLLVEPPDGDGAGPVPPGTWLVAMTDEDVLPCAKPLEAGYNARRFSLSSLFEFASQDRRYGPVDGVIVWTAGPTVERIYRTGGNES